MRIFLLFLVCVTSLFCCADSLWAKERVVFGQKPNLFALEVADDWKMEMLTNGLQLTSQDQKQSVAIAVNDGEGIALSSLERSLPARLELKDVKKKNDKNGITLTGLRQAIPVLVYLQQRDFLFVSVVATGLEKKQLDALLASLTPVDSDDVEKIEEEDNKKGE